MESLTSVGGKVYAQCSDWSDSGQRQCMVEIGTDGTFGDEIEL